MSVEERKISLYDVIAEKAQLFNVNYEGTAMILVDDEVYVSKNRDVHFEFRGRANAEELDGVDFYELSRDEVKRVLEHFDFEYEGKL